MKTIEAINQIQFSHDYLLSERKRHRLAFIQHSTPYKRVVGSRVPQILSEQADNLCMAQELLKEMNTWGELTTFDQLQEVIKITDLLESAIAFWDRVAVDLEEYHEQEQK